jgi:dihydroneopterin aldolase
MPTRRIIFSRLALEAHIGILDHERGAPQPLYIDAEIDVNITRPVDDHNIDSVLDYRDLRCAMVDECTRTHVNLIETLSKNVADRLMHDFADIQAVRVRISKPMAFSDCAAVAVEIHLMR